MDRIATNLMLDIGADMSFVTIVILKILWTTWVSDVNNRKLDHYFHGTVNSEIPTLGEIELSMTVMHVTQSSILMINLVVIQKQGKSIIAMGADASQKFGETIQFEDTVSCEFQGKSIMYLTNNGQRVNY